jgi:hypothetical protein
VFSAICPELIGGVSNLQYWIRPGLRPYVSGRASSAAEHYWLVTYQDQALRFTLRERAEEWAARLAAQGINADVTWHDEIGPFAS